MPSYTLIGQSTHVSSLTYIIGVSGLVYKLIGQSVAELLVDIGVEDVAELTVLVSRDQTDDEYLSEVYMK